MSNLFGFNVGFLIHILIEIPACYNFFVHPSRQLGINTPHAHPVIRQYATLLLTSILVALIFVRQEKNDTSGKAAAALAVYHIAPSLRSIDRLIKQARHGQALIPSEAFLYLVVHTICGAALILHFWEAVYSK